MLDEPTAALGVSQTHQVLDLVLRLRERGLGVIIISHNIANVFEVADRIVVLRLGRRVETFKASETTHDEIVGAITGSRQNEHARGDSRGPARPRPASGPRPPTAGADGAAHRAARLAARRARAGGHLDRLPVPERQLPQLVQPDEPRAADRAGRHDLDRRRAHPAARGDRPVGRRGQRPRRRRDGGAQRQARLGADPGDRRRPRHRRRDRALNGFFTTRFEIPSFVVTLAGLLAWQGALLLVLGDTGTVNLNDATITGLAGTFYGDVVGWILVVVVVGGFALSGWLERARRRRAGLALPVAAQLRPARGLRRGGRIAASLVLLADRGIPLSGLILVGLCGIGAFITTRTAFGRHVFAIGGNAEATRRAGISVTRVRMIVFISCSTMAAFGGIMAASRLLAVNQSSGGSDLLLLAIAGPGHRRHEPVRRPRLGLGRAARRARDRLDRQRHGPACAGLLRQVHDHRRRPAAGRRDRRRDQKPARARRRGTSARLDHPSGAAASGPDPMQCRARNRLTAATRAPSGGCRSAMRPEPRRERPIRWSTCRSPLERRRRHPPFLPHHRPASPERTRSDADRLHRARRARGGRARRAGRRPAAARQRAADRLGESELRLRLRRR